MTYRTEVPDVPAQTRQAVIHARVSSKEREKEGFSIPAQLKLLRGYASYHGFDIVREFVDVETAKQPGRPGFAEMVKFLKRSRTCRVVLVEKTDRLYRNLKDWVTVDDLQLEVHYVKENVVLSATSRSSEKFMHGIKVLMAKNYIDNLGEEASKGLRAKAEEGICPSFAPIGYCNVLQPGGKRTIEPDPERGGLVVKLFEWYATRRYSILEVAILGRQAGLAFRKTGTPVRTATVHHILRNPIYAGDFEWNGGTYHGVHQPLISRELWRRVQDALDTRNSLRPKRQRHAFAFAGLVHCGHCECAMVGEVKKGRYVYYHCTGYKGKCPEPYTREEALEDQFADALRILALEPDVLEWVTTALRQSHQDEKRFHDEAISRLQAEQAVLQNRLDAMYVDKLDGRVSVAFFDRKAAEWRAEQERIQEGIQQRRPTLLARVRPPARGPDPGSPSERTSCGSVQLGDRDDCHVPGTYYWTLGALLRPFAPRASSAGTYWA